MPLTNFPLETVKLEIQRSDKQSGAKDLRRNHVPFSGAPQKHPYNPDKIILITDPYSSNTGYYEFKTKDIGFVEELPNIATMEGEIISMARIWIKKTSVAVRSTPFIVEEIG